LIILFNGKKSSSLMKKHIFYSTGSIFAQNPTKGFLEGIFSPFKTLGSNLTSTKIDVF
jgi:hypothetical protein